VMVVASSPITAAQNVLTSIVYRFLIFIVSIS